MNRLAISESADVRAHYVERGSAAQGGG